MSAYDWTMLGGPTAEELRADLQTALNLQTGPTALPTATFPASDPMPLAGEEPQFIEGWDDYPDTLNDMRGE